MSHKISLKNMVFYGFHGVYEFERELGQRFYVDLDMKADLRQAGVNDRLEETIDYVSVYNQTKEIVENHRFQLLETLSYHIAGEVLRLHSLVEEVTVRVRKPSVPIAAALDCVEVEAVRRRGE
ncbi:dihydroneopterin aldolase [Sporomusa sphaeroides]|jgi:dihydroneopterin aldolase|uniref:dihydroneopterin aldolase n=1 Tax=Sporomusa sphaeroides TaxID=47679 RepID=UPI00202F3302|nr:dihydroneopterin aldolase [Sporomusa sphaeroides]MCM0760211.1 dihydroneopterin aldolase [Sporomusa sphaeroides DSM 2875]HML31473.1 dihydroneopterin aldolase [Sporomusa sphaeroides]